MNDLHAAAKRCLDATEPAEKLRLTHEAWQAFLAGDLRADPAASPPEPVGPPGRPAKPQLVNARQLPQRGLGSDEGRAALVHAVAHIEFNAINLAWDAVYRYRGKPAAYYRDWASCAHDEARHFALLSGRLAELGHAYGDFDAHDGLWEMAVKTSGSGLARTALVPRVLEARGLDVTPAMIEKVRGTGDARTVQILELILREEVAHVAAGSRWFAWCCAREQREPEATFIELVHEFARGALKGPFNMAARLAAGFSVRELERLELGRREATA